jgi:hypothetical protein
MEGIEVSPFLQSRGIVSSSSTFLEDPVVVAQSIGRGKAPHRRGQRPRASFSVADMSLSARLPPRMTIQPRVYRSSSMELD